MQMRSVIVAFLLPFGAFFMAPAQANDLGNTTWSESDAANNSAAPNGWASGQMTPIQVEPTARAMMGAIKRFYDHIQPTATSGGAANVQTLTYTVAPQAYYTGDIYTFIAGYTNTGATTLNVNSLGAKAVQLYGAALTGGEIVAGKISIAYYDGTRFQIIGGTGVQGLAGVRLSPTGLYRGIDVSQAASGASTDPDHNQDLNKITITDAVTTTLATDNVNGLRVLQQIDNGTATGSRNALIAQFILTHASGNTGGQIYSGSTSLSTASANDGGSAMSPKGGLIGAGAIAGLLGSGMHFAAIEGVEIDTAVYTGSTAAYKTALAIASPPLDAVQGTIDVAITLSGQAGSVGWKNGIGFGNPNGQNPLSTNGTALSVLNAMTIANWMDISNATVTGKILNGPGGTNYIDGNFAIVAASLTTGGNILSAGSVTSASMAATGNITAGGNLAAVGSIAGASVAATGNITANTGLAGGTLTITAQTSPAAAAPCAAGQIAVDTTYMYICAASGNWKRQAFTGGY